MKLLFRPFLTILLLSSTLEARSIILAEHTEERGEAILREALEEEVGIPKRLIQYRKVNKCGRETESILHLCLSKGRLRAVHKREDVLKNSFRIYGLKDGEE